VGFRRIVYKNPMKAKDFNNGYLNQKGAVNDCFESIANDLHKNIFIKKVVRHKS
jgi:hypothetical protein